jgi:hypothetical protein
LQDATACCNTGLTVPPGGPSSSHLKGNSITGVMTQDLGIFLVHEITMLSAKLEKIFPSSTSAGFGYRMKEGSFD